MRKPSNPSARKIYKVRMYGIYRYRQGLSKLTSMEIVCRRSRKPIGFRQWVVHKSAQFPDLSLSDFTELIEGFLETNELPYIDRFEVSCTFKAQYEYHQLICGVYGQKWFLGRLSVDHRRRFK